MDEIPGAHYCIDLIVFHTASNTCYKFYSAPSQYISIWLYTHCLLSFQMPATSRLTLVFTTISTYYGPITVSAN
jgi:hypothetical protein